MALLKYCFACLGLYSFNVAAQTVEVVSPDKRNSLSISNTPSGLHYTLVRDGNIIIAKSSLGLAIDQERIGAGDMQLLSSETQMVNDHQDTLAARSQTFEDHYRVLRLQFATKTQPQKYLNIHARVYDQGIALRYELPKQNPFKEFAIQYEMTGFFFPKDYQCFGLNQGKFSNGHEGEFDPIKASFIREHNSYDYPLVCKTGNSQTTFALAESNIKNYPASWLSGRGDGGLGVSAVLTPRFDSRPDGLNRIAVKGDLKENFFTPWRVIMLGDTPGALIEFPLVTLLGEPTKIKNTKWIKPGKVAWDWWNDNQVELPPNATVKPGMNTATYKAYIDFAATLKLEYILIDAGWHQGASWSSTPGSDVTKPIAALDMPEILRYAKEKNIGVWVWLQWKQLDWQMEEALKRYNQWGIKGIKVDFMERTDQEMLEYYHKLLNMTAHYHILVDLHGTFPAGGMNRTYPHLLTQEGVMGAEFNKWSSRVTARHNVTIPFTRMTLGPMDYTPGGFRHATPEEYPQLRRNTLPYVQTTRGQALAMYIVYDSPLQMLADSPITYSKKTGTWPQPQEQWQEGLDFIRDVPVRWNETKVLQGDIGEFIVTARRSGKQWYLGAMTNEQAREINIPLNFLGPGQYTAEIWQDDENISSVSKTISRHTHNDTLRLKLTASGGAAVVFKRK